MEFFIEALKFGGILFLVIMTIAALFHAAYFLINLFIKSICRLFHLLRGRVRDGI
jgi:hypothetical protein